MADTGLILKGVGGFYTVLSDNGTEIVCRARGRFRKDGITPVVGDRVEYVEDGEGRSVSKILPRRNIFIRPAVANLDKLIIVASLSAPKPDLMLMDKLIIRCEKHNVEPVIVLNKCDQADADAAEDIRAQYAPAGYTIITASAAKGDGVDAIKAEIAGNICCFAGQSAVGKSSLINKISGEERAIVSDIAGTTRDATDTVIHNSHGDFVFIDTAGLRRKSKVEDQIEKYSVIRARMAVERADVCVIMIDANEGFTEQDSKVAGIAHDLGKACIIAVNKWDAVEKSGTTMDVQRKKLMNDFSFMSYAPIIFISAKTGQRLDRLFELIKFVDTQNAMRISTGKLNDVLSAATTRVQPPTDKGRRLKIYYMTQASTRPPTFVCFVNSKDLFHYSYQRYIDNQIREVFGLEGTPTRYVVREREKRNGKKDTK